MPRQRKVEIHTEYEGPKSDSLGTAYHLIPWEGLHEVGKIFVEGMRYGRDNWKKEPNNTDYEEERCTHALEHLFKWANGDRSEAHLAKCAWFCLTQIWREKHKTHDPSS